MAVDFPSPAVDGQLYPDTAAGDAPLDNGRVYVFDGAAGIWNLQPASGGGSPISGGSGGQHPVPSDGACMTAYERQ